MGVILLITLVWIVGIVGCIVMKRIQPDNKLYPVYAMSICILLTIFVLRHIF